MIAVDLFAGAGGSSLGATQAGARVVWAANHWPLAVEVHRRNHPETHHECQDLHQCDWSAVRDLRPDLVLASPACQGHSRAASAGGARGSLPKHDRDRSTAWAVVSCLEACRAPVAVVENVLELRNWSLYPSWLDALSRLGYTAAEHVFDASWSGVPQRRKRLFVVLARSAKSLRLALPCESPKTLWDIYDDTRRGWLSIAEIPDGARGRIKRAWAWNGPGMIAVNYVTDDCGHQTSWPCTTITTKHQRAWVREFHGQIQRRMWSSREYARAMGFPDDYQLTGRVSDDVRLLGNAVCPPVMRALVDAIRRTA